MGSIIIRHPDFSSKAAVRRYRDAVDAGLIDYRRQAFPRHFIRQALNFYGGTYQLHKGMRKNPKKLPLVKSGRLFNAVRDGSIVFRGPAKLRRLVMPGLPRYLYQNKSGQFNKLEALQLISVRDAEAFGENVSKHHAQITKRRSKRGTRRRIS